HHTVSHVRCTPAASAVHLSLPPASGRACREPHRQVVSSGITCRSRTRPSTSTPAMRSWSRSSAANLRPSAHANVAPQAQSLTHTLRGLCRTSASLNGGIDPTEHHPLLEIRCRHPPPCDGLVSCFTRSFA